MTQSILAGVQIFDIPRYDDIRGSFFKTYTTQLFSSAGISFTLQEEFFSISQKNVLRGMHFQIPPHDHNKIVMCLCGRVLDVLLDLRKDSPTYGKHSQLELNGDSTKSVWIPRGIAHGFLSLEDNTLMSYKTDSAYSWEHDVGIKWDSFGMDWGQGNYLISHRDQLHQSFVDFHSPF